MTSPASRWRRALAGLLWASSLWWGAGGAVEGGSDLAGGALPVSVSRRLDASQELPGDARRFLEEHGARYTVYWDWVLGTPRLLVPREGARPIAPRLGDGSLRGDPDGYLVESVLDFIGENRDLFGVDPETLADEEVHALGDGWLVLFRQRAGGLPVRGAIVRALVSSDGELLLLKTYLLRDAPLEVPPPANRTALTEALAARGRTVSEMEAQWMFSGGDPQRRIARLWASVYDGEGTPGEVIADLETGEPMDEGGFIYGIGIYDGAVKGRYPTPNEDDPRFFFSKAADMDVFHVPGALIRSDVDGQFSDERGEYELLVDSPGDKIRWVLAAGRCRDEREVTVGDRTMSYCPVIDFDLEELYDMRLIVTSGGNCDTEGFRSSQTTAFIDPAPALTIDVMINSRGNEELSANLLAFRHVLRFMDHSDGVLEEVNAGDPAAPIRSLLLSIAAPKKNRRFYLARTPFPQICFSYRLASVWLPSGKLLVNQEMTPTLLNHEYAHHIIFKTTRFREMTALDCRGGEADHFLCDTFRPEGPSESASIVEGLADALAAYYADLPLFGFLGDRNVPAPQPIAYDISAPTLGEARIHDSLRWTVAHAFWGLRETFIDQAIADRRGENGVRQAKADAERLLYAWIALHRCIGDGCRAFEFGGVLVEELIAIDEMFNKGRNVLRIPEALDAVGTPRFVRGDADGDGRLMINDAIQILTWLFVAGGGELSCADTLDADDNGKIEVTDALRVLNYLFLGGIAPEAPFPGCGVDLGGGGEELPVCRRGPAICEPGREEPVAGG